MTVSKKRDIFCYFLGLGILAFSFLFALLVIFFHYPEVATSKGDQIIMEKQKPYILFNQRPDNLPHFCRQFRILISLPYYNDYDYDYMIVQATTSVERPIYSTSYSSFSFTEDIHLVGSKTRSLSYYLPSSSRVDITSCGQGWNGDDDTLDIPIFNDHGKMKRWLNSDEQNPESPDVIFYANFPPCPSMATVSFNTSGFPNGEWYFLLGAGGQYDDDDFRATLELQFTTYSLEVTNPIDICTANAEDYCELEAPSGNDVYLMLDHSINSTYPYASWIRVICREWDPFLSVMYFLVLPLGMSVCYFLIYCLVVYFGWCDPCCCDDSTDEIELTRYRRDSASDAGPWMTHLGFRGDRHSSMSSHDLPDYERADDYPIVNNDDGLANNFSTEINSDDSSYLSQMHDLSTDVTMVTDTDNPPAYDSVTSFDLGSNMTLPPAPGYEAALELNSPGVTMGTENPPSYTN